MQELKVLPPSVFHLFEVNGREHPSSQFRHPFYGLPNPLSAICLKVIITFRQANVNPFQQMGESVKREILFKGFLVNAFLGL